MSLLITVGVVAIGVVLFLVVVALSCQPSQSDTHCGRRRTIDIHRLSAFAVRTRSESLPTPTAMTYAPRFDMGASKNSECSRRLRTEFREGSKKLVIKNHAGTECSNKSAFEPGKSLWQEAHRPPSSNSSIQPPRSAIKISRPQTVSPR